MATAWRAPLRVASLVIGLIGSAWSQSCWHDEDHTLEHVSLLQHGLTHVSSATSHAGIESRAGQEDTGAATIPAGWFGSFSDAESTFTAEGVDTSRDNPELSVMHGRDPSLETPWINPEVTKPKWFHESESGGPAAAFQTHYPAALGTIAGNHVNVGNWKQTPGGWFQEYKPPVERHGRAPRSSDPVWFDNSVQQVDGYGRQQTPQALLLTAGWKERSVNTTVTCEKSGCTGRSSLQVFDGKEEDAHSCRLSIFVHATDYDNKATENIAYWKVNDHVAARNCFPMARGCGKTAETPLYPCVNDLNVDKIVDSMGTLVLEGKNTDMVDECPHKGNLLSAVAMATCMVRKKKAPRASVVALAAEVIPKDFKNGVVLKCEDPGCSAESFINVDPRIALNSGKCLLNVSVMQTDFDDYDPQRKDDRAGATEQVEFIAIDGKNITAGPINPGKNPCNVASSSKDSDKFFHVFKNHDITKMIKSGRLTITGGISRHVDECAYEGNMFYANVALHCFRE